MATQRHDQLSLSEYLCSATQPELEQFEVQRLAHASQLRGQFATLFQEEQFAAAFEDLVQAQAEATFARMLIEGRKALTEAHAPRELLTFPEAPKLTTVPPPGTDAQLAWERLEQIVQQRVDEVLAATNPGRFLEPEFRPQALVSAVMQRQTVWDRRKHSLYFKKWGCRQCARTNLLHSSNGYCKSCFERLRGRYAALKQEWDAEHPLEQVGVDPKSQAVKRLVGRLGAGK